MGMELTPSSTLEAVFPSPDPEHDSGKWVMIGDEVSWLRSESANYIRELDKEEGMISPLVSVAKGSSRNMENHIPLRHDCRIIC